MTGRRNKVAPRNDPDQRQVDRDVNRHHGNQADQNRARDHPAGILHFISDVTNIIIAEIIIDTHPGGLAKSEEESQGKPEGVRREIEGQFRIEMHRAGDDHHTHGQHRADPKRHGDFSNRRNPAIKQCHYANADASHDPAAFSSGQVGPQEPRILGEPDVPDAISKGPLNRNCQMNKNAMARPKVCLPKASRR